MRIRRVPFAAATLAVGLILVSACSAGRTERPRIGVVQVSAMAPLDETREGLLQALADSGFVRDATIEVVERNAQGDIPTLALIMKEFQQLGVTHVTTISSVATQAALKAFTDRPIVFGAVANPYLIGAGSSPTVHRPNVTGAAVPQPVDSALRLAHGAFPEVKRWGTLFDPADPFAEHYLEMIRHAAKLLGVELVSVACTNAQDIRAGVQALRAQDVGGIVQIPSIMIGNGFPALVKAAREARIPLIGTNAGLPGAPIALGLSFRDNGYQQGLLLIRVLRGEDPKGIPFEATTRADIIVDLGAAADFDLKVPPEVIARATKVIPAGQQPPSRVAPVGYAPSQWDYWLAALVQGLAFVALAWGVYVAARVLRFPDITPDGSFPLGAAVAATLIVGGVNPLLATLVAFFAGMVAGYGTGVIHARFKVTELLAGILMMTALYSVNLHVMGRSNVSLLDRATVATELRKVIPATAGWSTDVTFGAIFLLLILVIGLGFAWFLRTDFGMALRAVGDNPAMITAQGVDRRVMMPLGLALANGLVAISGALIAQYQGFADASMGVGSLVAGMAAVILGETLAYRKWRLRAAVVMVAIGAILFRGLIALALRVGLNPIDLKLATAAFVLVTLVLPGFRFGFRARAVSR
jgi:putative ABC transport system permease protein